MTATDPVQAVAEALHADQCPDDECGGGDMGEWERQAEIAVEAARPLIAAETLREAADSLYGDERANGDHWHPLSVASWLRERADGLEAGQ